MSETFEEYKKLMSIFYPEIEIKCESKNFDETYASIELPYRVLDWHRVFKNKELKEKFGIYYNFSDYRFPSPKFYKDTLKYEPYKCKEIDGVKWVHSIDMGTGVRQFY